MNFSFLWIAALSFFSANTVHATYSIVASDSKTGQVGGSVASCVPFSVSVVYGSAPGKGAVHAQSFLNVEGRDKAVELLEQDTAPDAIIEAITSPSFDAQASLRQYGVVDLRGNAAGYTGSDNLPYANDVQGVSSSLTYSIQGNILTGQDVIDNAEQAFIGNNGCDLADHLMEALEAAGRNGGDERCTSTAKIPASSASIRVDNADGTVFLNLDVINSTPENPVVLLRRMFDEWREENPCEKQGCRIVDWKVYDAARNKPVDLDFKSGVSICKDDFDDGLNIQAFAPKCRHVAFEVTGKGNGYQSDRIENDTPFFAWGNSGENVFKETLEAGSYSISAFGNGEVSKAETVDFDVIEDCSIFSSSCKISGFELWDSDSNIVTDTHFGRTLHICNRDYPGGYNIRAIAEAACGSVRFRVTGDNYNQDSTEINEPYFAWGNVADHVFSERLHAGTYDLVALGNGKGEFKQTITFEVADDCH